MVSKSLSLIFFLVFLGIVFLIFAILGILGSLTSGKIHKTKLTAKKRKLYVINWENCLLWIRNKCRARDPESWRRRCLRRRCWLFLGRFEMAGQHPNLQNKVIWQHFNKLSYLCILSKLLGNIHKKFPRKPPTAWFSKLVREDWINYYVDFYLEKGKNQLSCQGTSLCKARSNI